MIEIDWRSARPGRVAAVLGGIAGLLIALHLLAMQAFFNPDLGLRERFDLDYWHVAMLDLDEEESFGTWFSSVLLLAAACLCLARSRTRRGETALWRWWWVLSAGFLVLSVDEVAGMHEYLNTLMGDAPWTLVGFPILLLVALGFLPFLRSLSTRTALLLLAAGAVYGGGAVGVEHWTWGNVNSLGYNMWTALEEGMEMSGIVLFISAVLADARSVAPDIEVDAA